MLDNMTTITPPEPACDEDQHRLTHFWGEVSPSERLVQIYKDDEVFLDSLEGFVGGGIKAGDGVVVIATPSHLEALEHRLMTRGIDAGKARDSGQYLPLDARETLAKFMVDGPLKDGKKSWPDTQRFHAVVAEVIERASKRTDGSPRRVRAFAEMVAVLWADGLTGATVRLEHLWQEFCQKSGLCLFCAYPRPYITNDPEASMKEICDTHSRVVADADAQPPSSQPSDPTPTPPPSADARAAAA
jgi:hypothetical protein